MKLDMEQFKEGRLQIAELLSPELSRLRIKEANARCALAKLEAECRTTRDTISQLKSLKPI